MFEAYERTDGISGINRGYGLALTHLRVKVALERYGKKAHDAIVEELTQLIVKKKALKPVTWEEASKKGIKIIASHMFLRKKNDADGTFEKIKARLVGDGRGQDRNNYTEEEIASPTAACLESILNVLKIMVEEDRQAFV